MMLSPGSLMISTIQTDFHNSPVFMVLTIVLTKY
jgi:hypothetical protein